MGQGRFMMDYEKVFKDYCTENGLAISLSYDMPAGYETANGMFDPEKNTLFINNTFFKFFGQLCLNRNRNFY